MKHKPCAHQHTRGHRFGRELGLFLSRKNEDTGIPTSCLGIELWIDRLSVSERMSGYGVSGREKHTFAVCPSLMHPLLPCPHHLQDSPREGCCLAAFPISCWGALLDLHDEPLVTHGLLGALPSCSVMLAGLSLPWLFPRSQVSAITPLLLWPYLCLTPSISRSCGAGFQV